MKRDGSLAAVTFDCWNTLLYEPAPEAAREARIDLFEAALAAAGLTASEEEARTALDQAWRHHWQDWRDGTVSGGVDMARWALASFEIEDPAVVGELGRRFQEVSLDQRVLALEGARNTLETLARKGIRRALICDTGYSPARVVRELLARQGLLDLLEIQIFSDEAGVPKPAAKIFKAALAPLGVEPGEAVHVGDLRRTDIAGARAMGMGSIRIRTQFDDASDLPDADAVADSHAHLLELLAG